MIDVRVATPLPRSSDQTRCEAELSEKVKISGEGKHRMMFMHQYECAQKVLTKLKDEIDCNVDAMCGVSGGEFSADGIVEVLNPKQKKALDDAIHMLMQIGRNAKFCNGSSFTLKLKKVSWRSV